MAISRLQAALAGVTTEFTLAGAQINFDFTLIKCEAPEEFRPLGNALSKQRKEMAECGTPHITAKRLGALFDGVCPPTPTLFKAYGSRVSEIAEAIQKKTEPEPEGSIFAEHSGFDGTSIWAAATSSPAALHVQLLACMLARFWKAPEAISVWVELMNERRKEVESRWNGGDALPYSTITAAAQAPISRSSLADWDASARSWLRTADRIKVKEQNQLMLLIANLNIPINQEMTVYTSVISAWRSALESLESIITGMPQSVNSGPSLLALSSWHLYPDILVVMRQITQHCFHDHLVAPGGSLTVGLSRRGEDEAQGVFWSLSLAHMNHYGFPVKSESMLNMNSSHILFYQFVQAFWSGILHRSSTVGDDTSMGARLCISLLESLDRAANSTATSATVRKQCQAVLRNSCHWYNLLARAAAAYAEKENDRGDIIHKLVSIGRRRALTGIAKTDQSLPFLDRLDSQWLMHHMKTVENRITFLRRLMIPSTEADPWSTLIVYNEKLRIDDFNQSLLGLATTRPVPFPQNQHLTAGNVLLGHQRWTAQTHQPFVGFNPANDTIYRISMENVQKLASKRSKSFEFTLPRSIVTANPALQNARGRLRHDDNLTYRLCFGDPLVAALYERESLTESHRPMGLEDIVWCFDNDMIDPEGLLSVVSERNLKGNEHDALMALSLAARIYQVLPNATVAVETLEKPVYVSRWARSGNRVNRELALACVAYMQSGFDIDPGEFKKVFSIAYEDSIFVSMKLMCDPWESPESHELKQIIGNVGKPGLTLMIPPDEPMIQPRDPSCWRILSTTDFNGEKENHFAATSIHLSFTDYYLPVTLDNARQLADSQIYRLESVVSVHDSGAWVGDVDILKLLKDDRCVRLPRVICCENKKGWRMHGVVSAEKWSDILDPPTEPFVIRAHGNWVARLAAMAIYMQRLDDRNRCIVICPDHVCWKCNEKLWGKNTVLCRGHWARAVPGGMIAQAVIY